MVKKLLKLIKENVTEKGSHYGKIYQTCVSANTI